jgi:hypothetical protein
MALLAALVHPPDELLFPDFPEIERISFMRHRDPQPHQISGPVFAVTEVDSVPAVERDDSAETMSLVQII